MISIIVPAHNESSVIARTLGAWAGISGSNEIDVVVVCNGCTDDTAAIARRFGPAVRVIETEVASKTHALNLGDQTSRAFPRIYADADIVITVDAIRALASRLEQGDVFAAAPTAEINLIGCSWAVRKYFAIRSRLPSSREGIGGSGVYALSEAGRRRFSQFPDVIADDAFVRLQFSPNERETLASVKSTVFPPRTIRQLITVRARIYAGIYELAGRFPELQANKSATNDRTLVGLFKQLALWPSLLIYCYVTLVSRCRATLRSRSAASAWQRDHTSRTALSADSSN
jgi:glycosyltransferase involved in cell wall biosynthesis